jgi:non-ribosomal peptide synthetase component F
MRRLAEWNATVIADDAAGGCLHELVERRVRQDPDAIALRCGDSEITYAELNARANRLAHRLIAAGVGPDDVVGVLLERSLDLPVACGCAQGRRRVPSDGSHPSRLQARLSVARRGLPLGRDKLCHGYRPKWTSSSRASVSRSRRTTHRRGRTPGNLAYVIYTSGSSGGPKGVPRCHTAAPSPYVRSIERMYRLGPGDRVAQFSNPTFDVSIFDIFGSLASGATLVVTSRETALDHDALHEVLRRDAVTVSRDRPAMLAGVTPAGLARCARSAAAGEAFPRRWRNRWRAAGRSSTTGMADRGDGGLRSTTSARPSP